MAPINLTPQETITLKYLLQELKEIRSSLKQCSFSNAKIQTYILNSIPNFYNDQSQSNRTFTETLMRTLEQNNNRSQFLSNLLVDFHVLRLSLTEDKVVLSDEVKTEKGKLKKKKTKKKPTTTTSVLQQAHQNIFRVQPKIITDKNSQYENLQMQKAELRQSLMKIHMFKQFLQKELIVEMMGNSNGDQQKNLTLTQMWGFPIKASNIF